MLEIGALVPAFFKQNLENTKHLKKKYSQKMLQKILVVMKVKSHFLTMDMRRMRCASCFLLLVFLTSQNMIAKLVYRMI